MLFKSKNKANLYQIQNFTLLKKKVTWPWASWFSPCWDRSDVTGALGMALVCGAEILELPAPCLSSDAEVLRAGSSQVGSIQVRAQRLPVRLALPRGNPASFVRSRQWNALRLYQSSVSIRATVRLARQLQYLQLPSPSQLQSLEGTRNQTSWFLPNSCPALMKSSATQSSRAGSNAVWLFQRIAPGWLGTRPHEMRHHRPILHEAILRRHADWCSHCAPESLCRLCVLQHCSGWMCL